MTRRRDFLTSVTRSKIQWHVCVSFLGFAHVLFRILRFTLFGDFLRNQSLEILRLRITTWEGRNVILEQTCFALTSLTQESNGSTSVGGCCIVDRVVTQGIVDIELGSEAGQNLNSLNDAETAEGNWKSRWKVRVRVTSKWPPFAASCAGLHPLLSKALGSALARNSSRTTLALPDRQALCKAVRFVF